MTKLSKARYYIYRNLNKGKTFSVKYHGKVIARLENFMAVNVTFKVSAAGRKRALATGKRNVHAYAIADSFAKEFGVSSIKLEVEGKEVWYNPFKTECFMTGNEPVHFASVVKFENGKAWI